MNGDLIDTICQKYKIYEHLFDDYCCMIKDVLPSYCSESVGGVGIDPELSSGFLFEWYGVYQNVLLLPPINECINNRIIKTNCAVKYVLIRKYDNLIISYMRGIIYSLFYKAKFIIVDEKKYNNIPASVSDKIRLDVKTYEDNIGDAFKENYLKTVIADYYRIRDIKNARYYTNILIAGKLDKDHIFENAINEAENALHELKEMVDKNAMEHIVWNWVDAVPYCNLAELPVIYELSSRGISFTHMYSPTSYTFGTLRCMVTGGKLIDDGLWKMRYKDVPQAKLFQMLQDEGYSFKYIGGSGNRYRKTIFEQDMDESFLSQYFCSMCQYELLVRMANATTPTVFLVHSLQETHNYATPTSFRKDFFRDIYVNYDKEEYLKIRQQGYAYYNEQYGYYRQFYSHKIKYEMIFSDHGENAKPFSDFPETRFHTFMVILGKNISPRVVEGMHSLTEMPQLMQYLFDDNIEKLTVDLKNDYVSIQQDDLYSNTNTGANILNQYNNNFDEASRHALQFRGIITEKDSLVIFAYGKEYYSCADDSYASNDPSEHEERIKYLRELTGKKFINSFEHSKYKNAKQLYKLMNIGLDKGNEYVL